MTLPSRFYATDPGDPDAPRVLAEYTGLHHGTIRPGDQVAYENPQWRRPDGTYRTGGLDGPLTVTELVDLGDGPVTAVLNDGIYEVAAVNLRAVNPACRGCGQRLTRRGPRWSDPAGVEVCVKARLEDIGGGTRPDFVFHEPMPAGLQGGG